jgi:hypothetical protein
MIAVVGAVERSFVFPAERRAAFAFYCDFPRIVGLLPLVSLTQDHGSGKFRLLYHTTELGVYGVRIYCDVRTVPDRSAWVLSVEPLEGIPPVKARSGLQFTHAQGTYSSVSIFHADGPRTRIDYALRIRAELPTPLALRMLPGQVLNDVASSIAHYRIDTIANAFIARSIETYHGNGA